VKLCQGSGRSTDYISKEFRLYGYRLEMTLNQCKRFTDKQLKKIIELCLESERKIKTSPVDDKTELELLLINVTSV